MVGVFFTLLVIAVLLELVGELIMRVRVTRRASDKMAWWRKGGDEVADSYEQLFPGSLLPRYRRWLFWTILATVVAALLAILSKAK